MTALLGAVITATVAAGLLVAVAGLRGAPSSAGHRAPIDWRRHRGRAVPALIGLVAGWALTSWPAVGAIAATAGYLGPGLVAARADRAASLARTEALAGWAEMLRDTIVSHAGLREAIAVTAEVAPEPIRPAVRRLAARSERESLVVGLARFADEVADPVGDLVVAALGVAAEGQARNLPALLTGITAAARAETGMRLRVEAGRARTYSSSRALIGITLALSVSLGMLAPEFMAPYATATGQLMLGIVGALFAGALVALLALSRPAPTPRLLAGVAGRREESR